MSTIGIMGGTFNPIHIGHIEIAKAAYEQYHLDEVWFMPNHIPAYKSEDSIVTGEERLEMVRLAIQDIPYCKASDFELNRDGNTYTIDTLKLLKQQYPTERFYFIMGADSLFYFDKWRNYEEIPNYVVILVAPREEKSKQAVQEKIMEFNEYFKKECFCMIDCIEIPCSSSLIRDCLEDRNHAEYVEVSKAKSMIYLPRSVREYIDNHNLYI